MYAPPATVNAPAPIAPAVVPPICTSPPIPAPPTTCNAPEFVEVAEVLLSIINAVVIVPPLNCVAVLPPIELITPSASIVIVVPSAITPPSVEVVAGNTLTENTGGVMPSSGQVITC